MGDTAITHLHVKSSRNFLLNSSPSEPGEGSNVMSWLFGLDKKQALPDAIQVPVMGDGGGGGGENDASAAGGNAEGRGAPPASGGDGGYRSEAYSFDSTALERAAKAAKELEKSKYATQALDLSKLQEQTRQQEQMTKIKEYELSLEQMKIEEKRVDGEQKRKYMEEEAKH